LTPVEDQRVPWTKIPVLEFGGQKSDLGYSSMAKNRSIPSFLLNNEHNESCILYYYCIKKLSHKSLQHLRTLLLHISFDNLQRSWGQRTHKILILQDKCWLRCYPTFRVGRGAAAGRVGRGCAAAKAREGSRRIMGQSRLMIPWKRIRWEIY